MCSNYSSCFRCYYIRKFGKASLTLKLCWGLTIHKPQGLTLPNAIIDIGVKESVTGLSYVAISRVGKLSDLIIELTTLDRPNAIKKTKSREGKNV